MSNWSSFTAMWDIMEKAEVLVQEWPPVKKRITLSPIQNINSDVMNIKNFKQFNSMTKRKYCVYSCHCKKEKKQMEVNRNFLVVFTQNGINGN